MRQFVNRFQFAVSTNKKEATLNLLQYYPNIPLDDNEQISNETALVGSFVMSYEDAQRLADLLNSALDNNEEI